MVWDESEIYRAEIKHRVENPEEFGYEPIEDKEELEKLIEADYSGDDLSFEWEWLTDEPRPRQRLRCGLDLARPWGASA